MKEYIHAQGKVAEKPEKQLIVIDGDARHIKQIGTRMTAGRIVVQGWAGMHLGAQMSGGDITVTGNALDWTGAEMKGGLLRVLGDAGNLLGAEQHGFDQEALMTLLSQARYITLNTRWYLQKVPVSRSIAGNWALYSVSFLVLIVLVVSVLPTNYSLGLLSVLGYLLDIIRGDLGPSYRYPDHDVNYFIRVAAMPLQGVISISDYARSGDSLAGITPFEIADRLDAAADILLEGSGEIDPGSDWELEETLADIAALGYLGRYYARKVRGATYTAMYRWNGKEENRSDAVKVLEEAVDMWVKYAEIASSLYHPQLLARTRMLDWGAQLEYVQRDVEIARNAEPGESIEIEFDNILWKRDATRF